MRNCARDPGEYDHYVDIQQASGSADAHGHIDLTDANSWSSLTMAWAKCTSKGGREFWKVDKVEADVTHVWMVPYDSTLDTMSPKDRLVHDSVTYEIVAAFNVDNADLEFEVQTRRAV